MKKYRVIAIMQTILQCEVEAEDEQDAWIIANEKDGSEFSKIEHTEQMYVSDVLEM